jgi:hypothetical protein
MNKIFLLILGSLLCSISLFFSIIYLNLLTIGYTFLEYVKFINTRFECLCFYIGVILIIVSLERKIKNEFLLRNKTKF